MLSTMQDVPMSVGRILRFGASIHGNTEVTTWTPHGPETTNFRAIGTRAAALAHALREKLGVTGDNCVGSLMHNCSEHLEVMFAVAAMGAVFSPLNKQLLDDQLRHIVAISQVEVIVADPRLLDKLAMFVPDAPRLRAILVTGTAAIPDAVSGVPAYSYEAFLDGQSTDFEWPEVNERACAAMCYSTGTTGCPKGVAYSHRALYLAALALQSTDSLALSQGTTFLCCVPIYHVLSWAVPFAAFLSGTPLVLPDADMSAQTLADIIEATHPRVAHGVPTIWNELMVHYLATPPTRMSLTEIYAGGAPVSPWLIRTWEENYGVDVIHVWGMTETTTVGTVARPPAGASGEARQAYRISQGRFTPWLDYRVVHDGHVVGATEHQDGEIQVRGDLVTGAYVPVPAGTLFRGQPVPAGEERFTEDGWLRTGDVGSVTSDGYLRIADRARDVIRSGGEWIYSAQLENIIMESDAIIECAVIGIANDKWGERPLAVAVVHPGYSPDAATAESIRAALRAELPNWMVPEYWSFVDAIARTSVGKFDKVDLRRDLASGLLDIIKLPSPGQH